MNCRQREVVRSVKVTMNHQIRVIRARTNLKTANSKKSMTDICINSCWLHAITSAMLVGMQNKMELNEEQSVCKDTWACLHANLAYFYWARRLNFSPKGRRVTFQIYAIRAILVRLQKQMEINGADNMIKLHWLTVSSICHACFM